MAVAGQKRVYKPATRPLRATRRRCLLSDGLDLDLHDGMMNLIGTGAIQIMIINPSGESRFRIFSTYFPKPESLCNPLSLNGNGSLYFFSCFFAELFSLSVRAGGRPLVTASMSGTFTRTCVCLRE
jgi:hypothetical protein